MTEKQEEGREYNDREAVRGTGTQRQTGRKTDRNTVTDSQAGRKTDRNALQTNGRTDKITGRFC